MSKKKIIGILSAFLVMFALAGCGTGDEQRNTNDQTEASSDSEQEEQIILQEVSEGDLAPVGCVGAEKEECERKAGCVTIRIWQQINDAVDQVVDNITLADMLEWQAELSDQYSI